MTDAIVLQWTPSHGPRRKTTIKPTDEGWIRTEAQWDGHQWHKTEIDQITKPTIFAPAHKDSNPTPRGIDMLINRLGDADQYHNPAVGLFKTPSPIVITKTTDKLQYHTEQLSSGHPITQHSLRRLIQREGVPTMVLLSETPYSREKHCGAISR